MSFNPDSWINYKNTTHLLEKTITTSSFTKTKRATNSDCEYRDFTKSNHDPAHERLTGSPEDDIQSVQSYYKEEFKPIPSPRTPQPELKDSRYYYENKSSIQKCSSALIIENFYYFKHYGITSIFMLDQ